MNEWVIPLAVVAITSLPLSFIAMAIAKTAEERSWRTADRLSRLEDKQERADSLTMDEIGDRR
jgi:hypothetical protein